MNVSQTHAIIPKQPETAMLEEEKENNSYNHCFSAVWLPGFLSGILFFFIALFVPNAPGDRGIKEGLELILLCPILALFSMILNAFISSYIRSSIEAFSCSMITVVVCLCLGFWGFHASLGSIGSEMYELGLISWILYLLINFIIFPIYFIVCVLKKGKTNP